MKKALLFALVGVFTLVVPALAHPPAANVNFASERGVPFGLVLDGQPLTRGLARQVHLEQLAPGQHWADFTLPTGYGGAVRFRSRVWLEPGLETTFVLVARPGRPLCLQEVNAVALYGPQRGYGNNYDDDDNDGYYGGGSYNNPAPYDQGSYDPYNAAPTSYGNTPNSPNGRYGNTPSAGNDPNAGYGPTPGGPTYRNGNPTTNGGGSPNPAASRYRALSPQETNVLMQTVQARISEVSKLNAAKDGLGQRSLRADDLTRLLRSLHSEACRIDLAKFAHSHISDPENFSRVYEAFETEDGARAVEQAVSNEPQR